MVVNCADGQCQSARVRVALTRTPRGEAVAVQLLGVDALRIVRDVLGFFEDGFFEDRLLNGCLFDDCFDRNYVLFR